MEMIILSQADESRQRRCVVIKSEITELDSPDDWWTLCLRDSGNFLSHDAESLNKYIDLISDLVEPCTTIISGNIMWWMLIIFAWYENDWNTLKKRLPTLNWIIWHNYKTTAQHLLIENDQIFSVSHYESSLFCAMIILIRYSKVVDC